MFFGKTVSQKISRFVKEIPSDYVKYFGNIPLGFKKKTSTPKSSYRPPTAHRSAKVIPFEKKPSTPPEIFQVGDLINHKLWGVGTVMAVDSKTITISFSNPERGVKVLGLKTAPITKL